ncbi:hypothetical protein ACMXYO_08760 [Neptuniibacter sp. QD37_6]|uniref:hypothetical protein n=1 Tax=Neptuniibacter sp. QD37_6 TaxID=3398210 RepID=UPI0039F46003
MKEKKVLQIIEMLEIIREIHPEMTVGMMLAFFEVARGNGVTGRDLEERYDMKHAAAARILRYFDRWQAKDKEGVDLIEARIDPVDYKAKLRYLNEKGEAVMDRIDKALAAR